GASPLCFVSLPLPDLSRQSHPSQQLDIKVYLSFLLLYPSQAFFLKRGSTRSINRLCEERDMHEIPNLPFPSLHETEQTPTQQAGAQQPEPKEATERRKADSED
ncbi:hypothetical protein, partial [Pseudomonas sp. F01002]